MDALGFSAPHTPHHDHNHNHDTQHTTTQTNQTTTPTNQHTHNKSAATHSNIALVFFLLFPSFLSVCVFLFISLSFFPCLFCPFCVFSSCLRLLSCVFFVFSIVSKDVSCFLLCLCLFSLFPWFPKWKLKMSHAFPFFPPCCLCHLELHITKLMAAYYKHKPMKMEELRAKYSAMSNVCLSRNRADLAVPSWQN